MPWERLDEILAEPNKPDSLTITSNPTSCMMSPTNHGESRTTIQRAQHHQRHVRLVFQPEPFPVYFRGTPAEIGRSKQYKLFRKVYAPVVNYTSTFEHFQC